MPTRRPVGDGSRTGVPEVRPGAFDALIRALAPGDEGALGEAASVIAGWPGICAVTIEVFPERDGRASLVATHGSGVWGTDESSRLQLDLVDRESVIGRLSVIFDESEFVEPEVPARCETAALLVSGTAARCRLEAMLLDAQCSEVTGQIAAGLVHDFNNMLAGILGHVSVARGLLAPDAAAAEPLSRIEDVARSAADVSRALLNFVRGDIGRAELSVNELATATQRVLTRSVRDGVSLRLDLAPILPSIEGERPLIQQALVNLVLNAAQSIDGDGTVTIGTRRVDTVPPDSVGQLHAASSYMALSVTDTGGGIAPEHRSQLFRAFFSTKGDAGTGLGLSSVLQIVRRHGGAIDVASELGVGSTFTIYLPGEPLAPTPEDDVPAASRPQRLVPHARIS